MKFKSPYFILGAAILAAMSFASAQNDQTTYVSVDFKAMAWDRYSDVELYYRTENDEVKLPLRKMRRSRPQHYLGPQNLVFYEKEVNLEGVTVRKPVANVNLSPEIKDPLLLFVKNPNPQAEYPFLVWTIDDSAADFPFGAYQIINLSGQEIQGRIENEVYYLPRNGSKAIVTLPAGELRNVMAVSQIKLDGEWETASSSVWTHDPSQRNLVFILMSQNPEYGFFDMKFVPENRSIENIDVALVPEKEGRNGG